MMLLMLGCPVILLHAADFVCQTTVAAEKNRRNLDIVDIFAGKCAVKEGFCHMGANGEAFEKELNPIVGDILSTRGFLRLLQQTLLDVGVGEPLYQRSEQGGATRQS